MRTLDHNLKNYLALVISENIKEDQIVYTFSQLSKSRRYLSDQFESSQMKQALMCFMSHDIPLKLYSNREKKAQIEDRYNKELLWKIISEKDMISEA